MATYAMQRKKRENSGFRWVSPEKEPQKTLDNWEEKDGQNS